MPHVLFDEYFYCAGEHGKKVPNSKTPTTKTTSEQRHDYLLKYTLVIFVQESVLVGKHTLSEPS